MNRSINLVMEDHYMTLNIPFNARTEMIKKSYKKLALQYHPDKKNGNIEMFQKIQKAYEILSDDNKRRTYNSKRLEQMHRFARMRNQKKINNKDILLQVNVDLVIIYKGLNKDIEYTRSIKCDDCNGKGADSIEGLINCACCMGKGVIEDTRGDLIMSVVRTVPCDYCEGRGTLILKGHECKSCHGTLNKKIKQKLSLRIPPSVSDNSKMVYKSKGNGELGDLIVNYRVILPPNIKRYNFNLISVQKINIYELISLKNKVIEHPVEGKLSINLENNLNLNKLYFLGNLGLMDKFANKRGKFLIKFEFEYLENIDEELKTIVQKYNKENDLKSYIIREC